MKIKFYGILVSLLMFLFIGKASAQCEQQNLAFNSGEFLSYNMYYNWKFIWVKAGSASMSVVQTHYAGKKAFRASLLTRGSDRADKFFVLRDSIISYVTPNLEPLYFRKGSKHGEHYTVDEVIFSHNNGKTHLKQGRQGKDGIKTWKNATSGECVYDMLSIVLRSRSLNPDNWTKGKQFLYTIADGKNIENAMIVYHGKSVIKADNGKKYRCLELSYYKKEDGRNKEIIRFFISDDKNHIPIRLDMNLKFGSAKAFLTTFKGIKSAMTSEER